MNSSAERSGWDGPGARPASAAAFWIGYLAGQTITAPRPKVKVSRSRTVIGRFAGTVSSTGPSRLFSTWRSASSGRKSSTGSSSRSLHSSTRISVAAAVIGLVIEAMRKIVSRRIGASPNDCAPIASTWISPRRLTSATRPGMSPRETCAGQRMVQARQTAAWKIRRPWPPVRRDESLRTAPGRRSSRPGG